MVLFGTLFSIWLKFFASGREAYAVGGNVEAARLSGISERAVTIRVFFLNGLLVGVAAILYATNFTAIQSNVAPGFDLPVIPSPVFSEGSISDRAGIAFCALAVPLQRLP